VTIAPARRAAFEVVRRVFEDGAYADRAFAAAAAGLDQRDRALAQRIAYGTVQRMRTIDYGIDTLGDRPARKLDPAVLAALRISAYQLAWSEAPPHAVADDAVELVRGERLERATAFTNAVARRLAEGFEELVASLPDGALKESYPDWIFEIWERDWGFAEAVELARAQNHPGELVVRSAEPVGEPTDVPGAYRVDRVDPVALAEGRVWPQSRGSQLGALALDSHDGERVLDACAAPGGKATMLHGEVIAVELHPGRARELEENARRLGAANVRVVNADVRALAESGFDRALVDAPCSGLGVLGRRPDLRWRSKPLPELQLELLRAAAERTRPGGTIVYSVCTLNADENEAVVDASGLEVESLAVEWPQFVHPKRPEFLLTTPHRHGTSGFFIARLRNRSAVNAAPVRSAGSHDLA
jgi:16S rRNA (cytosine967-C5)-methyltransferase